MTNKEWLKQQLPHLDHPENYINEMNCYVRDWTDAQWEDKVKFCFVAPTPYEMMIANMGIAILYDQINSSKQAICERCYYPEDKLNKRLKKAGLQFFSKETCHNLKEFDVLGISSYFPQQMLLVPELLDRSGLKILTADRGDDEPLVIFGGCVAYAPEPVWNMVDICFLGQGEEMLPKILEKVKEHRGKPGWKAIVKDEICSWPGCYVPEYYAVEYYPGDHAEKPGHIKQIFPIHDGAPTTVTKATIDLTAHKPLTRTIVGNAEGLEMAAGAQLIAVGCSNKCFFCSGSWCNAPYRERPIEQVKEGFGQIAKDTGASTLVPFSFNHSDFSQINNLICWLLSSQNRTVGLSSQRIDYFDEDFAAVSRMSGHRTITLAIEGGSQRMRSIVNKNLTEEEILQAFRMAFRVGLTGIKVYMISNLPYETKEDRFAIVGLMKKILAIREEEGASTKIRLSYTPFQANAHTPLQWASPYRIFTEEDVGKQMIAKTSPDGCEYRTVEAHEVGMPVIDRNLNPVMDELQPLGIRVRSSQEFESAIANQALCLGDRRMAHVILDAYREGTFSYKGGMTVGKKILYDMRKLLQRHGLDYSYLFRAKPDDEIFPWQHLSTGIDKEYILKAWQLARYQAWRTLDGTMPEDMQYQCPVDDKFGDDKTAKGKRKFEGITTCWDHCTKCGICGKDNIAKMNRPDHSKDISTAVLRAKVAKLKEEQKSRQKFILLMKFRIFNDYRWMHNSKKAMHLRRAAVRAGLPILKDFSIASDNLLWQNWTSGVDYAETLLLSRPNMTEEEIIEKLNAELWNMEIVSVFFKDEGSKSGKKEMRASTDSACYYIDVPDTEKLDILGTLDSFRKAKSFIVKFKVKGEHRDMLDIIEHDCKKDRVCDVWAEQGQGFTRLGMVLANIIPPYDFLKALFSTRKRRFTPYPVCRVDYFSKRSEGEQDMFDLYCVDCDTYIEPDLFHEQVTGSHCIQHAGLLTNVAESENLRTLLQNRECDKHLMSPAE